MVDQVVIGFNDPHSAYHSADSIPPGGEDGIRVACSGGIGGAGAPHCAHCAPGLTTHCALRTRAFPSVALSMHPLPQRDAYPSGCDGNRTRKRPLLARPWPVNLRHTPYDSFLAGESETQWWADGRPLLAWCQRFSGCTPRPSLNTGVTTHALCTQGSSHCLHRYCRRAEKTSPKLVRYHCNQGNFRCPGISCIWR